MNQASKSRSSLDDIKTICNTTTNEYFTTIKDELGQAERLVSDAVNNLVLNFRHISELSRFHHDMVLAIEKMVVPTENEAALELLQRQIKIAGKIDQELSTAVTSLQFGDLVTQLLLHTTHQIYVLNITLHRLDRDKNQRDSCYQQLSEIHDDISRAVISVDGKSKKTCGTARYANRGY